MLNIFFFVISIQFSSAQDNPCSSPEANQFDFWVGDWQATWEGGNGNNTITKILNGCVIHEEFKAISGSPLLGISNSVYNSRTNKWQQTWVDNSGSYLDFSGEWKNQKMVLARSFEKDGQMIFQRMVWYNITENTFDWNWESSKDNGETWQVNWKIDYKRK